MEKRSGSGSDNKQAKSTSNSDATGSAFPPDLPQEVIPFDAETSDPPAYQESHLEPSASAPASASHSRSLSASASASTLQAPASGSALVPTITSPFNFPKYSKDGSAADASPPVYDNIGASSSSKAAPRPIAFPQVSPDPVAAFLPAYAPVLLSYGITEQTWRSFLNTISAFLTAKISDRALSHATDVAAHIGENPKNLGRNVIAQAKSIGKNVARDAKRGNLIGAAVGLIGGSISLPISTAFGIVGTTLSLPGSAIGAVTKKPRTSHERAATYAAVANEEWLHRRGLHALLFDSAGLAHLLGQPLDSFLSRAWETKGVDAAGQMRALEPLIAGLEIDEIAALQLKTQTLWLVLIPGQPSSLSEAKVKN